MLSSYILERGCGGVDTFFLNHEHQTGLQLGVWSVSAGALILLLGIIGARSSSRGLVTPPTK
jgi:hypothetical protein